MKIVKMFVVNLTAIAFFFSFASATLANVIAIQPGGERGEDAFVYRAEPDKNYGISEELKLGIYQNTEDNEHRAYVRFNLSDIPLGSTINSSGMFLHHFAEENGYYYLTLNAHQVLEDWSETVVAWNNQPAFNPCAESSGFFERYHLSPDWHSWDLTALTQFWVNGVYNNYGISINVGEPSQGYSLKILHSSDYLADPTLHPKLIVDYTPASSLTTLSYIDAFIQRSRENGSIDDDGIAEALQAKLSAASEKLQVVEIETAKNIFGAFVNSIEAQKGKHIDALVADVLISSTQYVISSLED